MLHHFFAADGAALPWLATAVVNHSSQEQTLSLDLGLPEFRWTLARYCFVWALTAATIWRVLWAAGATIPGLT